eukprot:NODE_1799_length_1064_cov_80.268966_g1467_i0.p2 GENE.NODE_1799_length_1064_cov_80.268966_g1467_i0~~NODE_1799_length_1064_cov_80.268966_g1467_i0.p2  ORF type:complete len:179 (-),score=37.61 NODE_1799_length_1064_cov_80.268966_g1467_i0:37-573(-)
MGDVLQQHQVEKVYCAVLVGEMTSSMECTEPIAERWRVAEDQEESDPAVRKLRMCVHEAGRPARTEFRPLHAGEGLTLCRVVLHSGRTHQIRVHAMHLGHPVLGDKLYGKTDAEFLSLTRGSIPPSFPPFGLIPRHLLHAAQLVFTHPITHERLALEAPPSFQECEAVTSRRLLRHWK